MCFGYFLTIARIHSLAYCRTVIVFGAVIGGKGSASGKFSEGILANLVREVFSNCLPNFFFFWLCPLLSATAFHFISELTERGNLTALQFLVKCVCDSQNKGVSLYKRYWNLSQMWKKRKDMCSVVEFTFQIFTEKEPPSLKVAQCCFFKAHL